MATATYEELLVEALPQVIENEKQYDELGERLGMLVVKNRRTAAEERLMRLLLLLVEDFDRRHALPPDDSTPAEILQFLLDHSGKKPADLLPIFGQRSHVSEALSGKRPISAPQARKLGAMFHMKPGLFL
jgi:HTH-type transcriptional regulator/antitoxin HigA